MEHPVLDTSQMSDGLRRVYDYWQQLRGEKQMPQWSAFDWMELPVDVIPWCVVVDVTQDSLDFIYRFWGTARTALQGKDYTGLSIRDVTPNELSRKIFDEYSMIAEKGLPVHFVTTDFSDADGKKFEYHFLRIPFGGDGQHVTQILAVGMHEEMDIKIIQNFFETPS